MKQTAPITLFFYLSGSWVDVTSDLIQGTLYASDGMMSNKWTDRLANTGELTFDLKNTTNKYSPGHVDALGGWRSGVSCKLVFTYDGVAHPSIWHVAAPDGIKIDPQLYGPRRVHITCLDWMDYAGKDPIVNPGILTNKRGDEVLTTTLTFMPIQPLATEFDAGVNTFPTVFGTVTSKTTGYDELAKVVLSELGYAYIRKDLIGETLVLENAHRRNGLRTLSPYPKASADSGFLLKEDGGYLLLETGGKIILNEVTSGFDSSDGGLFEYAPSISHGDNTLNRLTVNAYPQRIDASPVILFKLSAPMLIGSGQTLQIKGYYSDPNGGLPVNGQNMIDPVITTDYLVNTASDGSGSNISADLTIVTDYGTEGFTHTVTNGSTSTGYITLFNCRGNGIYTYNSISHIAHDQTSINANGTRGDVLNQKYQNTLDFGRLYADAFVEYDKNPATRIDKITFCANTTGDLMQAFLSLGVGDMIRLRSSKAAIDAYYYIQGREFRVLEGDVIFFSWVVKEFLSLTLGLSLVAAQFAAGSVDGINYGYLPHASRLPNRTVSAWIYMTSDPIITTAYGIISNISTFSGSRMYIVQSGGISVLGINATGWATTSGTWYATTTTISKNTWIHVAITYTPQDNGADPIMYVNGVSVAVTEMSTPSGAYIAQEDGNTLIGNRDIVGSSYQRPFDGKIKDARIYNRILTAAEILQMYNEGAGGTGVTSGLVFQGPVVRTKDLTYFTDHIMLSDDRVLDNIHGMVGVPHGAPVIRLP